MTPGIRPQCANNPNNERQRGLQHAPREPKRHIYHPNSQKAPFRNGPKMGEG
jgi:hypothetical protein